MRHTRGITFPFSIFPLLLAVSLPLAAQPVRVSVASAVESALANHASVKIAAERVNGAEARLDEAGAQLLPKLEVTGRAFQLSDVEQNPITLSFLPGSPSVSLFPVIRHSYAARLQLTQPLFNGFRLLEAKQSAQLNVEMTQAEKVRQEDDLRLDVETAYWGWVQVLEAQRVLEETAAQMKDHEARVMKLKEQGLATTSDVLNVRVRRSDVESQAVDMRSQASVARMRLNFLMGKPLETELDPEDLPESIPAASVDDVDRLVEMAIQQRPDLAAAKVRTEIGKTAVSMARGGWYPSVALAAAYEYSNPNQRVIPPKDQFNGTWEVGVSFRWTVWDWMTTSSQTAQAAAQERQAEAGYQQMLDGVRLEVMQLRQQVMDSDEKVAAARLALDAATEAARVTQQRFSTGTATSLEVTDANVDVLRARLNLTRAVAGKAIARAQLHRAVGGQA